MAEAVSDFLQNDLLAQASASNQAGPGTKPDPDLKVRTALDRAAARITGKFDKQPEVEAATRDTIGRTYLDLGLYLEAQKQLERALQLRRRLFGVSNTGTLGTMSRAGYLANLQGRYAEAEALESEALRFQSRILGPAHPDTLASMNQLGNIYINEGRYKEAEVQLYETVGISRRALGSQHPSTLRSMNSLAGAYYEQGKFE